MSKTLLIYLIVTNFLVLNVHANEKINLTRNQWHKVDSKLKLQVTKVLSDSRCPQDSQCIWAGEVTIEVELELNDMTEKVMLSPSHNMPETLEINTLPLKIENKEKSIFSAITWKKKKIQLISVSPYPGKSEKEGYEFEISNRNNLNEI